MMKDEKSISRILIHYLFGFVEKAFFLLQLNLEFHSLIKSTYEETWVNDVELKLMYEENFYVNLNTKNNPEIYKSFAKKRKTIVII